MNQKFPPRSKLEAWVRKKGGTAVVARRLGVGKSTLQAWLAGTHAPRLEMIKKIRKLSKLPAGEIFSWILER